MMANVSSGELLTKDAAGLRLDELLAADDDCQSFLSLRSRI